jgi:hypothetical protein
MSISHWKAQNDEFMQHPLKSYSLVFELIVIRTGIVKNSTKNLFIQISGRTVQNLFGQVNLM